MPAKKKTTTKRKTTTRKTAAKKPATKTTKKTTRKVASKKKAPVKRKTATKTTRKATKKTTTRKKAAPKRAVKKAVVAKPAPKAAPTVKDVYTKTQLLNTVAECAGLSKKEVGAVFDALYDVIQQHVKRRGPQLFTLPGLAKIKVVRKPATKARKGINPFTGEPTIFKAKPARNVVKIQALKKLKEMAE